MAELSDDTWTRGNWRGQYGAYVYGILGADTPKSLFGGKGWPIHLKGYTGDPKEQHRAWRSRMNTVVDDRSLQTPDGEGRVASVWDDYGEEKPFGKGPGLFVDLNLPDGPCLLSLYFFEVDWIQFRDYKLTIRTRTTSAKALADTTVGHFFSGVYKRFAIQGHRKITVGIEPKFSPNAVLAGVFIDRLPVLVQIPSWLEVERFEATSDVKSFAESLAKSAGETFEVALESGAGADGYLAAEGRLLGFMKWAEGNATGEFFGHVSVLAHAARTRLSQFDAVSFNRADQRKAVQLAYCWSGTIAEKAAQTRDLQRLAELTEGEGGASVESIVIPGEGILLPIEHYRRGNQLLFDGAYAAAARHFAQARTGRLKAEISAWAYLNEIVCRLRSGEELEASLLLGSFEDEHPTRRELTHAYFEIGKMFVASNRLEKARTYLNKAIGSETEEDALAMEARVALSLMAKNSGGQK